MRAITVRNPWAYAIAIGRKRIENRSWRPPVHLLEPGAWLAIHAGAEIDPQARKPPHQVALRRGVWTCPIRPSEMPWGAVVAVTRVVGVHDHNDEHTYYLPTRWDEPGWCESVEDDDEGLWRTDHRYGWLLSDVQRLAEPVPAPGQLGCWRLPGAVEAAVRAQLVNHGG